VTINTLRGLQSTDRRALELMRSYAAGRPSVLWKLRIPAALPYIFTALKVSATASIVGAIIGEAPSSIQEGLGGFIVNFNQYYSLNPENLWATNLIAALLGIAFFLVIVIAEKIVVRRAPENVA
jgi:NitT/TauT family transport system permease protein